MSDKPEKRLVSKHEYLQNLRAKGEMYSMVIGFGGFGIFVSLIVLVLVGTALFSPSNRSDANSLRLLLLFFSAFLGATAALFFWASHDRFRAVKQLEKVELVSPRNANRLPEQETLVRASASQPADQQAELLRSTQHSDATPSEELLRASTQKRDSL